MEMFTKIKNGCLDIKFKGKVLKKSGRRFANNFVSKISIGLESVFFLPKIFMWGSVIYPQVSDIFLIFLLSLKHICENIKGEVIEEVIRRGDFYFLVTVHGSELLCLDSFTSLPFFPSLELLNSIIPTVMTFSPLLFNILTFHISRMWFFPWSINLPTDWQCWVGLLGCLSAGCHHPPQPLPERYPQSK